MQTCELGPLAKPFAARRVPLQDRKLLGWLLWCREAQEQLAQVCSACLGKHTCLWSEQSSYSLILLLLLVSAQSKPCSPRMWFSYSTVLSAGFAGMDSPKCTR